MVCVTCVLIPIFLFIWGIMKPILNWFRKPVEKSEDQNADEDQVCSLLSSCPCINKNKKISTDQTDETFDGEISVKKPFVASNSDKKND